MLQHNLHSNQDFRNENLYKILLRLPRIIHNHVEAQMAWVSTSAQGMSLLQKQAMRDRLKEMKTWECPSKTTLSPKRVFESLESAGLLHPLLTWDVENKISQLLDKFLNGVDIDLPNFDLDTIKNLVIPQDSLFTRLANRESVRMPVTSEPLEILPLFVDDEAHLLPEYRSTRRGKPCGHVFKAGEPVFRCKTCALDDTCVLCSECFANSNHEGHEFNFHVGKATGGCCDCGDVEAWKRPLNCKYHGESNSTPITPINQELSREFPTLPTNLHHLGRHHIVYTLQTLSTLLDFILTTLAISANHPIVKPNHENVLLAAQEAKALLPVSFENDSYTIVLWNDEVHSYDEVITVLKQGLSMTEDLAKAAATEVDKRGKCVLITIPQANLSTYLKKIEPILRVKLVVTIQPTNIVIAQEVAFLCLQWIQNLQGRVREEGLIQWAFSQAMLSKWKWTNDESTVEQFHQIPQVFPMNPQGKSLPNTVSDREDSPNHRGQRLFARAVQAVQRQIPNLEEGNQVEVFRQALATAVQEVIDREDEWEDVESNGCVESVEIVSPQVEMSILTPWKDLVRLDHFFQMDIRMTKQARKTMTNLYIHNFVAQGGEWKQELALHFTQNYLNLVHSYLLLDREADLSVFLLAVQLFTVPTIAKYLVGTPEVVRDMCMVLRCIMLCQNDADKLKAFDYNVAKEIANFANQQVAWELVTRPSKLLGNKRTSHVFSDLRYLLQPTSFDPSIFTPLYYILETAQHMDSQRRTSHAHVEFEHEGWNYAFTVAYQMSNLLEAFAACCQGDALVNVLKQLSEKLLTRPFEGPLFSTLRSCQSILSLTVSFHHPLQWLLAALLAQLARESREGFDLSQVLQNPKVCLLPSLQTLALSRTIEARAWIRNGQVMQAQNHNYRFAWLREGAHDRDLLNAQAYLALDPLCLEDLISLFSNSRGVDLETQISCQTQLYRLVVSMLTERLQVTGATVEQETRREIIHHLASHSSGIKHSKLTELVTDRCLEGVFIGESREEEFDKILNQVANFREPRTAQDQGVYILKDQYWNEVDPWYHHYTDNEKSEVEQQAKTRLKIKVIPPRLIPIRGLFANILKVYDTQVFLKFLNDGLQLALTHSETDGLTEACLQLVSLLITEAPRRFNSPTKPEIIQHLEQLALKNKSKPIADHVDWILQQCSHQPWFTQPIERSSSPIKQDDKKLLAKQRQAAMLAQMQAQQQSFMDKHNHFIPDDDMDLDEEDDEGWSFPTGTCLVCQEDCTIGSQRFGMVCFVQPHALDFKADLNDSESVENILNNDGRLSTRFKPKKPFMQASSCGHLMHQECLFAYRRQVKQKHARAIAGQCQPENLANHEFLCPLCKSLANCLLPVAHAKLSQVVQPIEDFKPWLNSHVFQDVDLAIGQLLQHVTPEIPNFFSRITRRTRKISECPFVTESLAEMSSEFWDRCHVEPLVPGSCQSSTTLSTTISAVELAQRSGFLKSDTMNVTLKCLARSCMDEACCMRMSNGTETWVKKSRPHGGLAHIGIMFALFFPDRTVEVEMRTQSNLSRRAGSDDWRLEKLKAAAEGWKRHDYDALLEMCRMYNFSRPILMHDGFPLLTVLLVEVASLLDPENPLVHGHLETLPSSKHLELVMGLVRLVYCCEVVRISIALARSTQEGDISIPCLKILNLTSPIDEKLLQRLIRPWISKTEILLDSLGVVLQGDLDLHLPSMEQVYNFTLVQHWLQHASLVQPHVWEQFDQGIPLSTPFEFAPLAPRNDGLLQECLKFKCPKCLTTPTDPAVCLVCGQILCCGTACCCEPKEAVYTRSDVRGEVNLHCSTCTYGTGIYLWVNEGSILMLHGNHGMIFPSPYLDSHGEADPGLKKGKLSFLNQSRMTDFKKGFLLGQIPRQIAHKLESGHYASHWQNY